jgi:hypothetical protein
MNRNLTNQNDESNGPYSTSKKNHPSHNKPLEIDLSKMMKWVFLTIIQIGYFLLDFPVKKPSFLVVQYM